MSFTDNQGNVVRGSRSDSTRGSPSTGNKARVSFRLTSAALERITKRLADISQKAATEAIQKGMRAACQLIAKDAKARVRVRTGLLRKSIGWKVKTYPSKIVVGIVGPRKTFKTRIDGKIVRRSLRTQVNGKWVNPVKYAHLVEFGTVHSRPFPFMRPAWDANRGKIGAILTRHINLALRAVCKGR